MIKALIFIFEVSILIFLGFIYSELYLLRSARDEAAELRLAVSPGGSAAQDNSSVSWLELSEGEPTLNHDQVMQESPLAPPAEQVQSTPQEADNVDAEPTPAAPVEINND